MPAPHSPAPPEAVAYLRALMRDAPDGALMEIRLLPSKRQHWYPANEAGYQAAAEHSAEAAARGQNVYCGVCPRLREGGAAADVAGIVSIWADADVGAHKPFRDKAEARAAVDALGTRGLRPSIVVDSGGGLQPYYLLRAAYPVEDYPRAEVLMRRLRAALRPDGRPPLDAVGDLPRILRVPGTRNHKRQYGEPRPVRLLVCEPDRRYTFDDFDKLLPPLPADDPQPSATAAPEADSWSGEFVADPVRAVFGGCPALRALRDRVGTATADGGRHGLTHNERLVVASILRGLPGGREAVHDVMRRCADYDAAFTDGQFDSLTCPPMTCRTLRERKVCPAACEEIKQRRGKSPVAFAFGKEVAAQVDFTVQKVRVYTSVPPVYEIVTDGTTIRLTTAQLASAGRFALAYMDARRRLPKLPRGRDDWREVVNGWMATAEAVAQPPEASEDEVVRQHIRDLIESLPQGETLDDFKAGKVMQDEDGNLVVRVVPLLRPLRDLAGDIKPGALCAHLRALGWTSKTVRLPCDKAKPVRGWIAPIPDGREGDGAR